jgi:hypothetical protein
MPPHQIDIHRFHDLVRWAARADLAAAEQFTLLCQALDLWRGEPLAGLSGPWVETTREVLRQQRLTAVIAWARAALDAGQAATVIGPLAQELVEYSFAEPLVAMLMRALAATGRAAEALTQYAAVRYRLAHELGADPGAELQAVHRAILRGEGTVRTAPPIRAAPAQLPAGVCAFIGRVPELARLGALLTGASTGSRAEVPVAVLSGAAGVGKTALAVECAHRVADQFPDGQLYLNLGASAARPMSAGDALARLLTALNVPGPGIPPDVDDRAARYRSEVAGRRMLMVLDDAGSSGQVRSLLPGTHHCAVLVTSRDSLAGLVAVHGADRLDLGPLPHSDALALAHRLIGSRLGPERESVAIDALVHAGLRSPLELRVVAELGLSRITSVLVEQLAGAADRDRLNLVDGYAGGYRIAREPDQT